MLNESKHKYSTYVLLVVGVLIVITAFVSSIDGMGTKDYISKFTMGGVISNSSLTDDGSQINSLIPLYEMGVRVCTTASCGGSSIDYNMYSDMPECGDAVCGTYSDFDTFTLD
jgi:hypothetical protein